MQLNLTYTTFVVAKLFARVLAIGRDAAASVATILLFALVAMVQPASAQPPRYRLIDIGTFGGPQSYLNDGNDGNNSATVLNNRGLLVGAADTAAPDPFCFSDDCFVVHAFRADISDRTDLGSLVPGRNSFANWIGPNGLIAGFAENGAFDPLLPNFIEIRAVLWRDGQIADLGTLPEGGFESQANAVNSKGQVIGWATNTVPDSYSMVALGLLPTQTRAFLWENGAMRDLGTLGTGTDAIAEFINERGQVVGWSYTGAPGTCILPGSGVVPLATHSFFWDEKGGMRDLGTLGGSCTIATGINNDGVVIADNADFDTGVERGFIWKGGTIRDLGGSIGGQSTTAAAINESGEVAGVATLAGEVLFHATLWKRVGEITDLGALGPRECSFARSINSRSQVVGASSADCVNFNLSRAVLWENGSIFDLNALIAPDASLALQFAEDINDHGEIAGTGLDIHGNHHVFLLVPCDNGATDCQETIAAPPGARAEGVAAPRYGDGALDHTRQQLHRPRGPRLPMRIH